MTTRRCNGSCFGHPMRRWQAVLVLLIGLSAGCAGQAWQRYSQSPANPVTWVRKLFPPDGEYFYSDKAHEIERSLSREQNVDFTQ